MVPAPTITRAVILLMNALLELLIEDSMETVIAHLSLDSGIQVQTQPSLAQIMNHICVLLESVSEIRTIAELNCLAQVPRLSDALTSLVNQARLCAAPP